MCKLVSSYFGKRGNDCTMVRREIRVKNNGMEKNMKNKIVWFLGITFILPLICGMVMSVCTTF